MKKLAVIYRGCKSELLPHEFKSIRPPFFDKIKCASTLLSGRYGGFAFDENIDVYVVWDGEECALSSYLKTYPIKNFVHIHEKSNQKSLLKCYELIEQLPHSYFFLTEDDHCYLPGSKEALLEGLEFFGEHHVIALTDCVHRYVRPEDDITWGNDHILLTPRSHWRTAESAFYSFGLSKKIFNEIKDDLYHYCNIGENAPVDRELFRSLYKKNIRLMNPIPGLSTHVVLGDFTPLINWESYLESVLL